METKEMVYSEVAGKKAKFGIFIFTALVCFVVAISLACKAYYVKNVYSGGDAFNHIINASYFTGYFVSSAISTLCGIVCCATAAIINAINKSSKLCDLLVLQKQNDLNINKASRLCDFLV